MHMLVKKKHMKKQVILLLNVMIVCFLIFSSCYLRKDTVLEQTIIGEQLPVIDTIELGGYLITSTKYYTTFFSSKNEVPIKYNIYNYLTKKGNALYIEPETYGNINRLPHEYESKTSFNFVGDYKKRNGFIIRKVKGTFIISISTTYCFNSVWSDDYYFRKNIPIIVLSRL